MAEYAKVYKKLWNNKRFRGLSEDGRALWQYIITCPHLNSIGYFILPLSYITDDLQWLPERLPKPFEELLTIPSGPDATGWIKYDETGRTLLIPSWFEHNPVDNPNTFKKCLAELSEIPKSLSDNTIKPYIELYAKRFKIPLPQWYNERYGNPETESEAETESYLDIPFSEIIADLNAKAGTEFRHSSTKTRRLIKARFNDGYRFEDFVKVHDVKVAEWLNDSKMQIYLRPETLYSNKFESYVNQKAAAGSNNRPGSSEEFEKHIAEHGSGAWPD